ncbi:unnamed protein product [Discula destructiva]
MSFPKLPPRAAYIYLKNPTKRNALSLSVLQDLRAQLAQHLARPDSRQLALLPGFKSHVIDTLEADAQLSTRRLISKAESTYAWLVRAPSWKRVRHEQAQVLVLRSEGPVFSAGHDLDELAAASPEERREIFNCCAQVMALIRQSPALVVAPVQGFASAAGFQLAMMADVTIAMADTKFQLPGMKIGMPCISPVSAVSKRISPGLAYRMYATAEPITAAELGNGAVDVVPVPDQSVKGAKTREEAFEERVATVVEQLATETAGQAQAFGKWAYWTQMGIRSDAETAGWASRAMVLAARSDDAAEGIAAFKEKRTPEWPVWEEEERQSRH